MLPKEQSIIGRPWTLMMFSMVGKEEGGANRGKGSLRPGPKGPGKA